MTFDYFYGSQSESFSYYRIPRLLITDPAFRGLSSDAKLLYGLLLDRMGLSARNGWYDDQNRVFIYYTLEEIGMDLDCGHDKATKLLRELDTETGIGLIERVKQGLGKPTRIYVKAFSSTRETRTPGCGDAARKTAEKPQSGLRESRNLDCEKVAIWTAKKPQVVILMITILRRIILISAISINLSILRTYRRIPRMDVMDAI